MTDAAAWEDQLIAEMRANGGKVDSGPLAGHPLLILTSKGARSGADRRSILTYHRDGDDYVVAGTAGGSKKDPAWIHNLKAEPKVDLEVDNQRSGATTTRSSQIAEASRSLPWSARTSPRLRYAGTARASKSIAL